MSTTDRSRTEYSARNTSVAVTSRLLAIFMGYIVRIVFTHTLSEDYVGVNGLFLDIINILSLTELGVGAAITYALYMPIEKRDIEKQKSLMKLFKDFYHIVALIVAVAGLMVIPFMDVLIKDPPNVEHLTFIYLLYLTNSVSSYLLIYKKALIDAHQLAYIGTLYQTVSWMVQDVLQIAVLIYTRNFILYLLLNLAATIISNILISRHANKLYPFLKEKTVEKLPDAERHDIFKNVKAMLMHKVGTVVVSNTDNLIISAFVGIRSAGRYSNYYLITVSIKQVIEQFFQGIMASVGNLGVSEKPERIRRIFRATFFICQWLCCFSTIAFLELLDPFVGIFFGKTYIFSRDVTVMICISFYVTGMRYATVVFRDSLGIFYYDRYKAIFEAVFNLLFSIIFAQILGTAGVFLGTIVSTLLTSTWVEPYVLYKYRLKVPVWEYFGRYLLYVIVAVGCYFATDYLCSLLTVESVALTLIIKAFICLIVPNVIMLAVYFRTWEFKLLIKKAKFLLAKRREKTDNTSLSTSEKVYLKLLENAITGHPIAYEDISEASDLDWRKVIEIGNDQKQLPLLYDPLTAARKVLLDHANISEGDDHDPKTAGSIPLRNEMIEHVSGASGGYIIADYYLWHETGKLHQALNEAGIRNVLIKGPAISRFYPIPELRKSGDIDLWLPDVYERGNATDDNFGDVFEKARRVIAGFGYEKSEVQGNMHHMAFNKGEGPEVELHGRLTEIFDDEKMNERIFDFQHEAVENLIDIEFVNGDVYCSLSDADNGFYMILHMLQHYTTKGFGWKFLCDWTAFLNSIDDDKIKERLNGLLEKSGLTVFTETITRICVEYLGLSKEKASFLIKGNVEENTCKALVRELFESGEFGLSDENRMVVLRDTSIISMAREFHHQMKHNHPVASESVWKWPYLWVVTLWEFYRNNHKLRGIRSRDVIKNARQRSALVGSLQIFRK